MASQAVALPNGGPIPAPSSMHLDTNTDISQSIIAATAMKRKRESGDDDTKPINGTNSNSAGTPAPAASASASPGSSKRTRISKDTVRDYYILLERCDPLLLPTKPLPHCTSSVYLLSVKLHAHHRLRIDLIRHPQFSNALFPRQTQPENLKPNARSLQMASRSLPSQTRWPKTNMTMLTL